MDYPKTRGADAAEWLSANGLPSTVPLIRASDWGILNRCRFLYYLHRRLNLAPALRTSEALSRGSWFHARLEVFDKTPLEVAAHMHAKMEARTTEICAFAHQFGFGPTALETLLNRERQDMETAWAWFDAALQVRIPGNAFLSGGILGFLSKFRIIAREQRVVFPCRENSHAKAAVQYDLLAYDEHNNTLWDIDAKSTAESPVVRAQTCPFEFQTEHYIEGLSWLLADQDWWTSHGIAPKAKVGGRIHLIIQKPTIEFCGKDRDYTETQRTITKGERKGEVETKREYSGEPRRENYIRRCERWFLGTEEFADSANERSNDPPVNISITPASSLDGFRDREYLDKLDILVGYATADPFPENFPRSSGGMEDFGGKLSAYAPFYAAPIHEWPSLVARQHLTIKPRDPETPCESGTLHLAEQPH